ncbi:MAG TPA: VOC family protein [Thermodesulfobacteriota bacterium]
MSGAALRSVFLLVRDLARSRRFYEALAGRAPEKASAHEVRFAWDGAALTLHVDLPEAERPRWGIPEEPARRGWGVYLTFRTRDVDARAAAAVEAGGRLVVGPTEAPWGGRFAIVEDPDGYAVEIGAGA